MQSFETLRCLLVTKRQPYFSDLFPLNHCTKVHISQIVFKHSNYFEDDLVELRLPPRVWRIQLLTIEYLEIDGGQIYLYVPHSFDGLGPALANFVF